MLVGVSGEEEAEEVRVSKGGGGKRSACVRVSGEGGAEGVCVCVSKGRGGKRCACVSVSGEGGAGKKYVCVCVCPRKEGVRGVREETRACVDYEGAWNMQ